MNYHRSVRISLLHVCYKLGNRCVILSSLWAHCHFLMIRRSILQSALHLHTVRLLTEGDEAVVIQFVLLRMSSTLLETY